MIEHWYPQSGVFLCLAMVGECLCLLWHMIWAELLGITASLVHLPISKSRLVQILAFKSLLSCDSHDTSSYCLIHAPLNPSEDPKAIISQDQDTAFSWD